MTRFTKKFAAFILAAGLAVPAMVLHAEDKVPTPVDSATGVPGSNQGTVGGNQNLNKGPTGSTGAVNTQRSDGNAKLDSTDQQFVLDAANGGMAEVKLGKLAQEKGQSQAVKDFGKKMVEDHQKANEQLKQIASSKGITLSADVTGEEREHYDMLAKYNGAEFDKMYTKHMMKDHQKDISEFKKESQEGKDADVKAFATSTLPTLREHMKMVRQVASASGDTDLAKMASEKQGPDEVDSGSKATSGTGTGTTTTPGSGQK